MVRSELFKSGMRRLAASVCVVTTIDPDGVRRGLTATAVCSLHASPPTLLSCLNRASNTFLAIEASGVFAVNVLASGDQAIAVKFAASAPGSDKFDVGEWTSRAAGAPILAGAVANFDCRLKSTVAVGTHAILIGEVEDVRLNPAACEPLLYGDGRYGGFLPDPPLSLLG